MSINTYTAFNSLENKYISRKVTESYYSILIGIIIFTIVGMGFYLQLNNLSLVIVNLIVIAVPIGIFIYKSTFKQANNINTIISTIYVTNDEYRIQSYSFKSTLFFLPPVESVVKIGGILAEKVNFPYNEDGLESDKKDTLCINIEGKKFYLLYKYFPASLLSELMP